MNIVNDYLIKYVSTGNLSGNKQYKLYIREIKKKSLITNTQLLVVLILESDSLYLDEIINNINAFQKNIYKGLRSSNKIIISSRRGSIYLYESIFNEDVWKKSIKKNHICVINSDNCTICITPGHIKNTVFTERLKVLIEEYKYMNRLIFEQKIFTLFSLLIENI